MMPFSKRPTKGQTIGPAKEIDGARSDISARTNHAVASARLNWIGTLCLSLVCCCLCVAPASIQAASPQAESTGPIAVEANPQIFATMCALVAAGFEADSAPADPDLAQLRTHLSSLHGPAAEALRDFYSHHALADSGATLSRFMTFALVAGPAPNFEPVLKGEALPPGA